jgi:sarcosine oxidase delta subunit
MTTWEFDYFDCPYCDEQIQGSKVYDEDELDTYGGSYKIRCPHCKQIFRVDYDVECTAEVSTTIRKIDDVVLSEKKKAAELQLKHEETVLSGWTQSKKPETSLQTFLSPKGETNNV